MDKPISLTPAQRSAIESQSHSVMIANAGSGKTYTLVAHYLHLLEHNDEISPTQIAAITFTENAASELRQKITESISKRLALLIELSADPTIIDRLWKALQELDASPISTIHGFCSRLLREHPIEAGIDPAFGIILGVERTLLVEESIDKVLHDRLRDLYKEPSTDPDGMLATFNLHGRGKIHNWIRVLLDKRFLSAKAVAVLREHTDESLETMATDAFAIAVADTLDAPAVRSGLARLSSLLASTKDAKAVEPLFDALHQSQTDTLRIANTALFLDAILTSAKVPTPRSVVFKDRGKGGVSNVEAAHEVISTELAPLVALRDALSEANLWNAAAPHSFSDLRNVVRLYEECLEEYAVGKLSQGLLDHDDLIEYGVQLLRNPEVAAEVAATLRYCFVDEYQDTDDRQYNLLRSLTCDFTNHLRVTIVGDPKQSIYRFRDADLEVFHETVSALSKASGEPPITLDVCFRLLPFPLTLANKVTDHLFGNNAELREKYFYRPLVTARKEEGNGAVSLLLAQKPMEEESGEDDEPTDIADTPEGISEEELIARAITERRAADDTVKYADMAMLLRDRKKLASLEVTLRHHSIPYSLSSGLGFYQQQEVIDALTLLSFLIDPSDELYLVALLRSPYVEFDDRTIWNLLHHRGLMKPRPSLWQYLHDARAPLTTALRSRLEWLDRLIPFAGRIDTESLLERAMADSQIELTYLSFSDGVQKVSNLRKLVSIAGRSDLPVWEFVEQCRILQEHDDREQQAVQPTDDAVHIMTIHASKGLEFPIVFLPFLADAGKKRTTTTILTKQFPHVTLEEHSSGETIRHPFSLFTALREKDEETEEELRILYVALTRAKNETYLSATLDPKKGVPPKSQFARIMAALSLETDTLLRADAITLLHPLSRFADGRVSTTEFIGQIPIRRMIEAQEALEPIGSVITTHATNVQLQPIEPSRGVTRYSPTQLLTYHDCPTKYFLRYNLGFPEVTPEFADHDRAEETNTTSAAVYGTLLHAAFEGIDKPEFVLTDQLFTALAFTNGVPAEMGAAYRQRLQADIARALASPLLESVRRATENYAELPLRFALQEQYVLSGILDRLFLDADGVWNVVDYKTTKRPDPEQLQRYEFQTKLYAFLVFKLFDCPTVATHLYFTTTGQTVSKTYSDIDLAGFEAELLLTIEAIVAERKSKSLSEITRVRSHCPECPYSTNADIACVLDVVPISNS